MVAFLQGSQSLANGHGAKLMLCAHARWSSYADVYMLLLLVVLLLLVNSSPPWLAAGSQESRIGFLG